MAAEAAPEASALGIRRIEEPEQLWRMLDDLGDEQSHYLLEQFVPGDIFHVDSIVSECEVKFQAVHQYGRPPMQVMHEGGVFTTRTVDRESRDCKELTALNAAWRRRWAWCAASPMPSTFARMPMAATTFLKLRPGWAARLLPNWWRLATGVNLWREWARLEVGQPSRRGLRAAGFSFETYAGSVLCLAQTAEPDTAGFDAPEIVVAR